MKSIFVLDTSVLVNDSKAFLSFNNNMVILPIIVIEELDKVKKLSNESGKNARVAIRALDEISNKGEVHKGIIIENNITLKIDIDSYMAIGSDKDYGDNKILACALKTKDDNASLKVILVSRDINLRIRARALGIEAQDYEKNGVETSDVYVGEQIFKNEKAGNKLLADGIISINDYKELEILNPNEFALFSGKNGKGIASGRRINDDIVLVKEQFPLNLKLRNKEQLFASDILMDVNVPLVSIVGPAGGGKSIISLACSLELVLNKRIYDSLVMYRPIQPMGNDIGYLPGSSEEKLSPYYESIGDSMAYLFPVKSKNKDGWKTQLHQYLNNGTIQMQALTFIRGRSFANSLIFLDEAQNMSCEEIKTIITRVGEGSKIIISGDIDQIDSPHLDATNNGLTYIIEKFKTSGLAGHITFSRGERSDLATLASEIL